VTSIFFGVAALGVFMAIRRGGHAQFAALKNPKILRTVVIATLLGTYLGIWLQVTGLRYAPAGVASTLSSTSPIFILPLSAIFLSDRVGVRAIAGACLAVAGIAVLFIR
jgi:drug/metabolite transporter (DMT)-like permease